MHVHFHGADGALDAAVAGRLAAAGIALRIDATPGADASPQDAPLVLVVGPGIADPLAHARRIARGTPDMRFVFGIERARLAEVRRQASYAAPPGGRWSMLAADDDALPARVRDELAIALQQRRLRTTLDRMSLRAAGNALPDAGEYRRLVASDRYLASVLRHAHDAIVSLDARGLPVSWNRGAELLFGMSLDQACRQPFASLFRNGDTAETALGAALSGSFCTVGLETARGDDVRYLDANFGALRDDGNALIGAVAILRDITERHRAEEELRAASRQKDEFLAMLAHELRNPLAPIRSAARILDMLGHPDPRGVRAAEVIQRQAEHMTGLIDDLLDVARVTRGTVALEREVLPIADVVHDAVEQARALIDSRGHRLRIDERKPGLCVHGDRKRLTQVVANLLVNAAKYTHNGGAIDVVIDGDAQHVDVAVVDNGIGMSAELVERAFELFMQAERSPDRAEGGLGIGLSLVRSLVAMHGGSVAAHSDGPGRGSRFEIRLPRAQARAQALAPVAPSRAAHAPQALHIMVVDDNEDAAHTLAVLLRANGHRVDVEIDPRHALAHAGRVRPDVFILDIGMPHLDGYELARRIRALRGSQPLLVALTGYGHASDRERARLAGFDRHLVKPLDPEALVRLLDERAVAVG